MIRRILAEEHFFVPALDHNIRYIGRWMPTSNRLRWDTAFPGAYIDLTVRNASSIYLSLHNAPFARESDASHDEINLRHMTFKPSEDRDQPAAPVTLAVSLCDGTALHFPSSEDSLLAIDIEAGADGDDCSMRISYAGEIAKKAGVFQFKGVWLPLGASLQPRVGTIDEVAADTSIAADTGRTPSTLFRKTIEFVTDSPNYEENAISQIAWPAQLAAQFDVDQVKIPVHGHCLTETCINKHARDVSTQDLFFRSGPANNIFFSKPWNFHQYVPDVLVLDLGTVEHKFYVHGSPEQDQGYVEPRDNHHNFESFANSFVSGYVAFIQQIRRTAYPLHPAALEKYAFDGDGYTYNSAPSTLPIFVMRPLDGSLAPATLAVVEQMQKEGDKSVFWIDTSGWLSEADYNPQGQTQDDRFLTASGHARVASFMHAHLCHYLAPQSAQCLFLRRDNYMGSVFVPIEAELHKVIEESKIKKLTELFWTLDQ
jgi:hypothetical protein